MANYRGAIDRYITPNLGRAMVHEVDAATLDTLYAAATSFPHEAAACRDKAEALRVKYGL